MNVLTTAPIALIGMMGAGKTSVGRRLAERLGREFVDADRELEARCGVPVATIFDLEGEDGFRRRETALIDELTLRSGIVLATGGGAVTRPENCAHLRERTFVVYLRTTAHEVWLRTRRDRSRPLLQTANPRARIAELIAARDPLYRATAAVTVQTGRQPIEQVVDAIIGCMPQALLEPPAG